MYNKVVAKLQLLTNWVLLKYIDKAKLTGDIGGGVGGGVDNEVESLVVALEARHVGHHRLEVVAEGHGDATDDQAGVVEKQPPKLPHNPREGSEAKPGHRVADSNQRHQVTALGLSQAKLESVVLNIVNVDCLMLGS